MIDQGLGLKVSPYDDLLVPSIVTRNTKWNYTFVFFHYTWWRAAPDDCSQWHNSYVTNMSCPPPSNFIKMTLIFICVNITIWLYITTFETIETWILVCVITVLFLSTRINSLPFSEYHECLSFIEVKLGFWK